MNWLSRVALVVALMALPGCGDAPPPLASYEDYYDVSDIKFIDDAPANAPLDEGLTELTFTDLQGQESRLGDYAHDQNVVLVITRGNTQPICPYCTTQTADYIRDYQKFRERGCEVLLVYPIASAADTPKLSEFLNGARARLQDPKQQVPFPVLLDVELKAVDRLGIRKTLSKPATYLVDRQGVVRYAYVGSGIADRPSISAVLGEIDKFSPPSP